MFSIKFNEIDHLNQVFKSKIQHQKSITTKKRPTISCQPSQKINLFKCYAFAVSIATTETKERLSFFLRNSTKPSVKANKVWSLPIPTFAPG